MSIDEKILHERKLADYYRNNQLKNEAQEHEQLAEWLEELKEYRKNGMCNSDICGYNKAIDDFTKRISEYLGVESATKYGNKDADQQADSYSNIMKYEIADAIEDVAEQLKKGGVDAGRI